MEYDSGIGPNCILILSGQKVLLSYAGNPKQLSHLRQIVDGLETRKKPNSPCKFVSAVENEFFQNHSLIYSPFVPWLYILWSEQGRITSMIDTQHLLLDVRTGR